jgi:hypothetical protein
MTRSFPGDEQGGLSPDPDKEGSSASRPEPDSAAQDLSDRIEGLGGLIRLGNPRAVIAVLEPLTGEYGDQLDQLVRDLTAPGARTDDGVGAEASARELLMTQLVTLLLAEAMKFAFFAQIRPGSVMSDEVRDETAQEAALKVYSRIDHPVRAKKDLAFLSYGKFRGYVSMVVNNEVRDNNRKEAKHRSSCPLDDGVQDRARGMF